MNILINPIILTLLLILATIFVPQVFKVIVYQYFKYMETSKVSGFYDFMGQTVLIKKEKFKDIKLIEKKPFEV